jgi:hypothetical protein
VLLAVLLVLLPEEEALPIILPALALLLLLAPLLSFFLSVLSLLMDGRTSMILERRNSAPLMHAKMVPISCKVSTNGRCSCTIFNYAEQWNSYEGKKSQK